MKVCVDIGLFGDYDSGCFVVVAATAVALSRVQRIAPQTHPRDALRFFRTVPHA